MCRSNPFTFAFRPPLAFCASFRATSQPYCEFLTLRLAHASYAQRGFCCCVCGVWAGNLHEKSPRTCGSLNGKYLPNVFNTQRALFTTPPRKCWAASVCLSIRDDCALLLRWRAIKFTMARSRKSFDWHAVACKLTAHCNAATKWRRCQMKHEGPRAKTAISQGQLERKWVHCSWRA